MVTPNTSRKFASFEINVKFATAVDLDKCLKTDQITDSPPYGGTYFRVTI